MSDDNSAKDLERSCPWADDFQPLRELVKARGCAFHDVNVRDIVRTAAGAAHTFFEKNTEAWRTNPALVVLGTMDEKGGAVMAAKELMGLAKQGVRGIAQAMLQHMPDTADRSEVETAITSATSGLGLFFQTEPLEVYGKLAKLTKPKAKLVDVAGGEDLHDTIWAVACYWMVGNFYSETVVKTLEHGLHGTQRRTQACATRLGSARHRERPYPLTAADFASASAEIGTNQSTRVIKKEGIEEELVPVNLNMLLELEDVGEEGEPYEDEDDGDGGEDEDEEDEEEQESAAASGSEGGGGEGSKAEGRLPGWPTNPKVGELRIQRARDVLCADEHLESRRA